MRVGSSSVEGISRAISRLEDAAAATYEATVPTDTVSLESSGIDPLIDAATARSSADVLLRANVKVLQTAQQMDDVLMQLLIR